MGGPSDLSDRVSLFSLLRWVMAEIELYKAELMLDMINSNVSADLTPVNQHLFGGTNKYRREVVKISEILVKGLMLSKSSLFLGRQISSNIRIFKRSHEQIGKGWWMKFIHTVRFDCHRE
jgi:hypothetical protein